MTFKGSPGQWLRVWQCPACKECASTCRVVCPSCGHEIAVPIPRVGREWYQYGKFGRTLTGFELKDNHGAD